MLNLMLDKMKVTKRSITPAKLRNICMNFSQGKSKIEDCLLNPKSWDGKPLNLSFHTLESAAKNLCEMQDSIASEVGNFLHLATLLSDENHAKPKLN